ncbi:MAG: hypothetical protein QOJ27_2393 [Sphingomonadales bacterium]|nr:hypothetical protein [Sphingomonadales bacterium]
MDDEDSVLAMAGWFLQNFELPEVWYPASAGPSQYIHEDEDPTYPQEELELKFGDYASPGSIAEAASLITRGGRDEWAPSRRRVKMADFDDHVDEHFSLQEREIEEGLQELEELVAAWRHGRPPMGHNSPPEERLETDWPTDEELDAIEGGIQTIRRELHSPSEDLWAVQQAANLFTEFAKKLLRLAQTSAAAIVRFSAEAAAAAGVGEAIFHPADFAAKLTHVSGLVHSWTRSLGL